MPQPAEVRVILSYTIPGTMDEEAFEHVKRRLQQEVASNPGIEDLMAKDWTLITD